MNISRRSALITGAASIVAASPIIARATSANTVVASSFASLEEALAAVPARGKLIIDSPYDRSKSLVVDRSMAVEFSADGIIRSTGGVSAMSITASDVVITNARLEGGGRGTQAGIDIPGTREARPRRIAITAASISGYANAAIRGVEADSVAITGCKITNTSRAGILLNSCADCAISDNDIDIDTITPVGADHTYGINVSRPGTDDDLDRQRRCTRILISHNRVANVPDWEGIDSHAGEGITVVWNTVVDCLVGIAIIGGQDADRSDALEQYIYAPLDCYVGNNTVKWTRAEQARSGIVVRGATQPLAGDDPERATVAVVGNTVEGYGGAPLYAAIDSSSTAGLIVARNTIYNCITRGIQLISDNKDAVIAGNAISGTVQQPVAAGKSPIPPAAIDLRGADNSVLITGTSVAPGPEANRGIYAAIAGNSFTSTGNDWSSVTTAIYSKGNEHVYRINDGETPPVG